jgi:hypothetical protein
MKAFQYILCFALATIGGLAAGCNSVLGVADVALEPDAGVVVSTPPPDVDRSACKLDARFPQITMTSLSRGTDGSPNIFVRLNGADALLIALHDNAGGHGALQTFGTYQLTSADSRLETCGICVLAGADYNSTSQSYAQDYVSRMQGQLQITTATTTQLIGSMQDLVLRHVNLDTGTNTTTDASDGCTTAIGEIDFNLTYSAVTVDLPAVRALRTR